MSSEALRYAQREAACISETILAEQPADDSLDPDERLKRDLQACVDSVALIEPEQEKLRLEIDKENDPVKRDYLWYFHDLIPAYLNRAAEAATRRQDHLADIHNTTLQEAENERCAGDIIHWFRWWAWTLDPRMPLKVIPLWPFRFQIDAILWIESLMRRQIDGVMDKSREQGASWLITQFCKHQWRYSPFFQALFGSKKENAVDSISEPDTLLEKVRFQLRREPEWMLPLGFSVERHAGYMKIINPETGSVIAGEAPTPNFGASGRYSIVVLDEHALWPHGGYPQWTSCSQSARCKVSVTTPRGKFTKQSELRHSGKLPVLSLHWKQHPWKDERWYAGQALSMDAAEIAQELDIDYEASQPGRIFPMWDEVYHVITWSEFKRVYGALHIPVRWNLARAQDVGTTPEHPNVTAWSAKPHEDDPYTDTVFFYREFVAPTDWTIQEIGEGKWSKNGQLEEPGIWQRESPLNEKARMKISLLSKEGHSEQRTYQKTCTRYPVIFSIIKEPGPNEGLSEMRALMQILPEPHPFVIDPRTEDPDSEQYVAPHSCEVCRSTHAGAHLLGRPRFLLVVDDDEARLLVDQEGRLYRTPPKSEAGMPRARYEVPLYHYPAKEKDKPVAARCPFKRDDDWIDDARYICRAWGPPMARKTRAQRFEEKLPEHLRAESLTRTREEIAVMSEHEREQLASLWLTREIERGEIEYIEQQKRPKRPERRHRSRLHRRKSR